MKRFFLLLMFVCQVLLLQASSIKGIKAVAGRVAPWLYGKIEIVEIPADEGRDVYELHTCNGKLIIKANCMPAAGMGLNHYLKLYCKRHFSLTGTNLAPISVFPEIQIPVRKVSSVRYRHIMNFCTQNYSGAFWTWKEWERMIDFMVLNGVNLALTTTGLEQVWYNMLQKFNFTEKEILDFLPGPAFNAWHMMANMEGWGGPITMETIRMRSRLQKKITDRLREYGISPIFMSFYGMVPTTLKEKYPDVEIKVQGKWVGGFERPDILVPGQTLYDEMADVYYKEVKKLYGSFLYFAGEPFHEGGIRTGIDIGGMARIILDKMRVYNPECTWMLQAWGNNPSSQFLSQLSKEGDVLIWDMRSELMAQWETRKGYEGYPYLWGVINNFGETPGLYGRLERFNKEYFRAKDSKFKDNLQGLCVAPEGILNNPVNYDFLFNLAWLDTSVNTRQWIEQYSEYRYGTKNEAMRKVWDILLSTAYSSEYDLSLVDTTMQSLPSIAGNAETFVAAPPALNLKSASSWGSSTLFYDYKKMRNIAPLLLQALNSLKGVDAFGYDLVDFTRQLLSNEFKGLYQEVNLAIQKKDLKTMTTLAERMLDILADMDELLLTRSEFMVGTWLNNAKRMGTSDYEKSLYEKNARAIITYWGPDSPNTSLRDYAHKEWAGLIKDVYLPRWKNFFDYHRKCIEGIPATFVDPVEVEIAWAKQTNFYPYTPQNDLPTTAERILRKFIDNHMR